MFKHILLPVDGSELSHKAVSAAIQFARTAAARLTPYMCVETYPYMVGSDSTHERREVFQQRVEAPTATCRCWCSADGTPPTPPPGQIRPTRRGNRCPVLYHIAHIRKRPFAPRPQAAG